MYVPIATAEEAPTPPMNKSVRVTCVGIYVLTGVATDPWGM